MRVSLGREEKKQAPPLNGTPKVLPRQKRSFFSMVEMSGLEKGSLKCKFKGESHRPPPYINSGELMRPLRSLTGTP